MEKNISNPQPPTPHLVRTLVALHVVCIAAAARCSWEKRAEQRDGWVCVRVVRRLKHCMRLDSNLSHLDASRRYRQTAKLDAQTNKRTNKHTNIITDKVKVELDGPRAIHERLVYQMPVQGRRTTLLDAITQAHSTAHMEQNATRIIPLPNSLLPGT
jgi:hypothetical protein